MVFTIVFLLPGIALPSYWYVKFTEILSPVPALSLLSIILFFIACFIGANGEEIGWSGYIISPLQNKYLALKASIVLGIIWAVWYFIPWSQVIKLPR